MTKGYIKLPRSLLEDPLWKDLPPAYKEVFLVILENACFQPRKFDDFGEIIELLPGQFCASIREILELCGKYISKNDVERSIKKLILCQFVRHEVRHRKSIITITHQETYESIFYASETASETNLRQTRDKLETQTKNDKNDKNDKKKEKVKKESPPQLVKKNYRENVTLTEDQYANLLAEHGQSLLDSALDILDAYKGSSGKKYVSDFHAIKVWVIKRARDDIEKAKATPSSLAKSDKKPLWMAYKDGREYNGYTFFINGEAIGFTPPHGSRDTKNHAVKFNAFNRDKDFELIVQYLKLPTPDGWAFSI